MLPQLGNFAAPYLQLLARLGFIGMKRRSTLASRLRAPQLLFIIFGIVAGFLFHSSFLLAPMSTDHSGVQGHRLPYPHDTPHRADVAPVAAVAVAAPPAPPAPAVAPAAVVTLRKEGGVPKPPAPPTPPTVVEQPAVVVPAVQQHWQPVKGDVSDAAPPAAPAPAKEVVPAPVVVVPPSKPAVVIQGSTTPERRTTYKVGCVGL